MQYTDQREFCTPYKTENYIVQLFKTFRFVSKQLHGSISALIFAFAKGARRFSLVFLREACLTCERLEILRGS